MKINHRALAAGYTNTGVGLNKALFKTPDGHFTALADDGSPPAQVATTLKACPGFKVMVVISVVILIEFGGAA